MSAAGSVWSRMRGDYRDWMALGPGGLPANAVGWIIASVLRAVTRETTSVACYRVPDAERPALQLPRRQGARPAIGRWPIPHRQLDQLPAPALRSATQRLTAQIAGESPGQLETATSKFERRGEAVFAVPDQHRPAWLRKAHGEAGHVHGSDGSLHLVLHPADARTVIEAQWGERHPLCGVPLLGIPTNYLMVYAPRDELELATVAMLFRRAAGQGT